MRPATLAALVIGIGVASTALAADASATEAAAMTVRPFPLKSEIRNPQSPWSEPITRT